MTGKPEMTFKLGRTFTPTKLMLFSSVISSIGPNLRNVNPPTGLILIYFYFFKLF